MSAANDGGPAFPVAEDHRVAADLPWTCGMSLRDYFAAQAMTAMLTGAQLAAGNADVVCNKREFAESAYAMADAMLRAREQS